MSNTHDEDGGFNDPADWAAASYEAHPVDEMEPLEEGGMIHISDAALIMARFFSWISEGSLLSEWGTRAMAAIYCVRPDLLNGMTLEQIGKKSGKTRQAIDKHVLSFRDSFGGIASGAMRSEKNRLHCKESHLTPTPKARGARFSKPL